jgi:peptidyl-prolyl cis-trans isomerase A (cyclophilin A)
MRATRKITLFLAQIMNMRIFKAAVLNLVTIVGAALGASAQTPDLGPGIYVNFHVVRGDSTVGDILAQLDYQKVPMTVANFVGLAEGNFQADGNTYNTPFYDGIKFHRVIPNFMIQGGDPQGSGMGGPKHRFYDEFDPSLRHSGPGVLSMANSGPATNGSQFFITHVTTPWLDNKHSVFGHVIKGQEVVDAVKQGDVMQKVTIVRVGEEARSWNATEAFSSVYDARKKEQAAALAEKAKADSIMKATAERVSKIPVKDYNAQFFKEIKKTYKNAKQTPSGLVYVIEKKGTGKAPAEGDRVEVHYKGTFMDGRQFDSSYDRNQPLSFNYKQQPMIGGFNEALALMTPGTKGKFFLPYHLAYGAQGRGDMMPPYSDLVFNLEMLSVTPAPKPPVGN